MAISNQKGLTLIETLVTLGIFSTVVVFTMGLFINANKAQVAANEMNLVNSEASFLLERISREIRMAKQIDNIDIPEIGSDAYSKITFTNHDNVLTVYCQYNSSSTNCHKSGDSAIVNYAGGTDTIINSSKITVADLKFYSNANAALPNQPIITIFLTVESKKIPGVSISLQTSVVPRVY